MLWLRPPEVIDAELYTSMPDRYRRRSTDAAWVCANRRGAVTHSFLEGPVFDWAGTLYVTDIPFGRIFRIDADGSWELVVEYDGEPNGMKFRGEHELVVADYRRGLLTVDVRNGRVDDLLGRRNSESFKGVNDLTIDSAGAIYFTDQGQTGLHDPTGRVYRLQPDGKLDLLLSNVPSPNGVVLSNDERVLFVAATRGNCVWRAPLQEDGGVSKVGQFFTSHGPSGPDGLAMDHAGRLIVCNPGLGYAWVLNSRGEPEAVVRSQHGTALTNVALAGSEPQVAYFTESSGGHILRTQKLSVELAANRAA
jgi:gluconolactonase